MTRPLVHERTGSGPTLVLVHGLGSAATVWKLVTPALARSFDVVAIDLPGHGRTPWTPGMAMDPESLARYVNDTLDAIGIERAHVAGNSLGGWVALAMAAAQPDRIASVVALAPAGMRDRPARRIGFAFKVNRYLAVAARPLLPLILPVESLRRVGLERMSPIWKTWSLQTCRDAAHAMARSPGYSRRSCRPVSLIQAPCEPG